MKTECCMRCDARLNCNAVWHATVTAATTFCPAEDLSFSALTVWLRFLPLYALNTPFQHASSSMCAAFFFLSVLRYYRSACCTCGVFQAELNQMRVNQANKRTTKLIVNN